MASERDAAIISAYRRLGWAEKAGVENGVSKKTALRVLKREGIATRDRVREREERLQRVQELEDAETPRMEMPALLGISLAQLYLDLGVLGIGDRRPRKYPKAEPRQCGYEACGESAS